jgi:hypothetical protein
LKKPNLILHIGHSKTGTTTIQNYLAKNSSNLIKLGYLYPVKHSPRHNHVLIQAGFLKEEFLRVRKHQVYAGDKAWFKKDYERFWKTVKQDIKRHNPHTVILSAEQMFRDFSDKSKIELADYLAQEFDQVKVACYIRSPISYCISSNSQKIKVGVDNLGISHHCIRSCIEYYESQFPGNVYPHSYERSQLTDGDVVTDFLTRYLPEAIESLQYKKPEFSNKSPSWELLRSLRTVRMTVQPKGIEPLMDTRMLLAKLSRKYKKVNTNTSSNKIKLLPEVEDLLIRSSGDYLWLRDKYGITFSDIDYESIDPGFNLDDANAIRKEPEEVVDISNTKHLELDIRWYETKGIMYHLNYIAFILRLRIIRIYNTHIKYLLLKYSYVRSN